MEREKTKNDQENSLSAFYKCPRNSEDWEGAVWALNQYSGEIYRIAFGDGTNDPSDVDDEEPPCDDYIMCDTFALTGDLPLQRVADAIRNDCDEVFYDPEEHGLEDTEAGGMWCLRRSEWENGDIRRFILDAFDFIASYGSMDEEDRKAGRRSLLVLHIES